MWISEVMLQQTRVDAVLPYYRAWMERFPDVGALAAAPLDDVLKAWEGLGYYSRARNLHRAARLVRDQLGGTIPATFEGLRGLPGVGEYTAGAVASIAFGERVPAVDGNVRRVLARLLDEAEPTPALLRAQAGALMEPDRPGDSNQALMELGATVCTPRAPGCDRCPVADDCAARRAGTVLERPRPRRRPPVPEVEVGVAVVIRARRSARQLLLVRRPTDGLLGGLWEMPSRDVAPRDSARVAAAGAARAAGVAVDGPPLELPRATHLYSHFRGLYAPFFWEVRDASVGDGVSSERVWVDRAALGQRALPAVQRRIAEALPADLL